MRKSKRVRPNRQTNEIVAAATIRGLQTRELRRLGNQRDLRIRDCAARSVRYRASDSAESLLRERQPQVKEELYSRKDTAINEKKKAYLRSYAF